MMDVSFGDSVGEAVDDLRALGLMAELALLKAAQRLANRWAGRLQLPFHGQILYTAVPWGARPDPRDERLGDMWTLYLEEPPAEGQTEPRIEAHWLTGLRRVGPAVIAVEWDHSGSPKVWILDEELEGAWEPLKERRDAQLKEARRHYATACYFNSYATPEALPLQLTIDPKTVKCEETLRTTSVIAWKTLDGIPIEMTLGALDELSVLSGAVPPHPPHAPEAE